MDGLELGWMSVGLAMHGLEQGYARHPRSGGGKDRRARRRRTRSSSPPLVAAGTPSTLAALAPPSGCAAPCIAYAHFAKRSADPAGYDRGGHESCAKYATGWMGSAGRRSGSLTWWRSGVELLC